MRGHQHSPRSAILKDINEIGACRLCCVEVEGMEQPGPRLQQSWWRRAWWSSPTTPQGARGAQRPTCELILSQHDCQLRDLRAQRQLQRCRSSANDLDMPATLPYQACSREVPVDHWTFPLIREIRQVHQVHALRADLR